MTNLLHTKCVRNKTLLPFSVIHAASHVLPPEAL